MNIHIIMYIVMKCEHTVIVYILNKPRTFIVTISIIKRALFEHQFVFAILFTLKWHRVHQLTVTFRLKILGRNM